MFMFCLFLINIVPSSRYKYDPDLLRRILFPSPSLKTDQQPPRKRRRIDDAEDGDIAMDIDPDDPATASSPLSEARSVILETPKESYLLSPSILDNGDGARAYDIALVLEGELEEEAPTVVPAPVVETTPDGPVDGVTIPEPQKPPIEATDTQTPPTTTAPVITAEGDFKDINSDVTGEAKLPAKDAPNETASIGPPPSVPPSPPLSPAEVPSEDIKLQPTPPDSEASKAAPVPEPTPAQPPTVPEATLIPEIPSVSSRRLSTVSIAMPDFDDRTKPLLLQALQRHLGEEMFQFTDEGIKVADGITEELKTEWTVQVKRWKWGPRTA
jgi:hypothetical protein